MYWLHGLVCFNMCLLVMGACVKFWSCMWNLSPGILLFYAKMIFLQYLASLTDFAVGCQYQYCFSRSLMNGNWHIVCLFTFVPMTLMHSSLLKASLFTCVLIDFLLLSLIFSHELIQINSVPAFELTKMFDSWKYLLLYWVLPNLCAVAHKCAAATLEVCRGRMLEYLFIFLRLRIWSNN